VRDDDVPFMNYRVYACPECGRVLRMVSDYAVPLVMRENCAPCDWYGTPKKFVTGGYKGTMLIWNEVSE
jgi:acetone carboxylase gamma subunit